MPQPTVFSAGPSGPWIIESVRAIRGENLSMAPRLGSGETAPPGSFWHLQGTASYERYTQRPEKTELVAIQPGLGRHEASYGALIPIAKDDAWWAMTPEERRSIFEEQSKHIAIGFKALPAIARKLYQSRDLGEPFDFLTWFEFAPEHAGVFDQLLKDLRATREWDFVSREVEIRVRRA